MTGAPTPSVTLAELLGGDPQPRLAIDLDTMAVVSANRPVYELLGIDPRSLEGTSVTDIVLPAERPAAEASVRLLASGAIDGYRAVRHLQKADGSELTASVWAQMTSVDGNRLGLVAIEADATGLPWLPLETSVKMALAVTDHQWVIEHASSDTEAILGLGPEAYEGSSLLALLQPADVQGFMGAVGRVAAGGGAATLRLHFRTETGRWQDVYCVVVAMCRHSPPRLGLALALISEPGGETACRQIAARGVDALNLHGAVPVTSTAGKPLDETVGDTHPARPWAAGTGDRRRLVPESQHGPEPPHRHLPEVRCPFASGAPGRPPQRPRLTEEQVTSA